jgi:hypothetical protein
MQGEPRQPGVAGNALARDADREVAASVELDEAERLVLGDLINRVLDKGVVISGQVTISVADIDLIALDLRVLITSIQTAIERTGLPPSPSSRAVKNADVPVLPPDADRGV